METIYLIDKNTNQVINTFTDVISWTDEYVMYNAGKGRGVLYINENEYLTNVNIQKPINNIVTEEN